MGQAFGISQDDAHTVLQQRFGAAVSVDAPEVELLFSMLDDAAVEDYALGGDDLDDQTDGAYDEIERQWRKDSEAMAIIQALPKRSST